MLCYSMLWCYAMMVVISLYVETIRITLFQMYHILQEHVNTSDMKVIISLLIDAIYC